MAVILNQRAYDHARELVAGGQFVLDDRDRWSGHRPFTRRENDFVHEHGTAEYARWYLGVDDDLPEWRRSRYTFPYGDFARVHRCGVLAASARAAQNGYHDIVAAVAHLHGLLDGRC
jgi:hypothetical protein